MSHSAIKHALTLRELISVLQELAETDENNASLPVVFTYDYGDDGHTPAVLPVVVGEFETLENTGYSPTGLMVKKLEEDETPTVLVLSNATSY